MKRHFSAATVAASLFLVAPLLAGCGRNDPAATVRAFLDASRRHDEQAATALLTKKAQEIVGKKDSNVKVDIGKNEPNGDYTVGAATVTGDEALVPVTGKEDGKDQAMQVKLRREDGQWRIYAFVVSDQRSGIQITVDLEHPEHVLGEALGLGFRAMGDAMKSFGEGLQKGLQGGDKTGR